MMPANHPSLAHRIQYVRNLASRSLDELREVIWDLRPTILDDLGLIPAIRWYARTHLEKDDIQVDITAPEEILRLRPYLETMLFRVTQEALTNIKKHAGADLVTINIEHNATLICLDVRDNGHGFNVDQTAQEAVAHQQLGLLGIQERIALVGGKLQIESAPGTGTHLHVCIPLIEEDTPLNAPPAKSENRKIAEAE
jgi:signal transduction histidine kinase